MKFVLVVCEICELTNIQYDAQTQTHSSQYFTVFPVRERIPQLEIVAAACAVASTSEGLEDVSPTISEMGCSFSSQEMIVYASTRIPR